MRNPLEHIKDARIQQMHERARIDRNMTEQYLEILRLELIRRNLGEIATDDSEA
mgnify:CR=1 FL=1